MNSYFYFYVTLLYYLLFILFLSKNILNLHPFVFMGMLVVYTMILCYSLNFLKMNFMYSYILFLVMIGGLMILFMYFTSLASNQIMKIVWEKSHDIELMFLFSFTTWICCNEEDFNDMMMMLFNQEIYSFKMIFNNLNYLFNNMISDYCIEMNFYMIFYLFLMMICSVLICLKASIPLRQMIF